MTNDRYEGWTNRPTWAVNLWLSNDQGLYETALVAASEAIASGVDEDGVLLALADRFEGWVGEEARYELASDGAGIASDLLGWALALVDWREIAEAWLQSAREADLD